MKEETRWPVTLMGVLSTVLLSAGVLRHYYDIYVHRTVRGISFLFVGIDAAGDVFSLVSICKIILIIIRFDETVATNPNPVFQPSLDILGIVIYSTEFCLWCGVFACGGYFNLMPWLRQKSRQRASRRNLRRSSRGDPDPTALESHEFGVSNDVDVGGSPERIPSSRSVFRTPSAITSLHSSEG